MMHKLFARVGWMVWTVRRSKTDWYGVGALHGLYKTYRPRGVGRTWPALIGDDVMRVAPLRSHHLVVVGWPTAYFTPAGTPCRAAPLLSVVAVIILCLPAGITNGKLWGIIFSQNTRVFIVSSLGRFASIIRNGFISLMLSKKLN